jgi:hypothetical protein
VTTVEDEVIGRGVACGAGVLVSRGTATASEPPPGIGGGSVPARLPAGAPAVDITPGVELNAVVVSAPVPVIGGVTTAASPGALIVDVTPLACPSWTTSYCWSFRTALSFP